MTNYINPLQTVLVTGGTGYIGSHTCVQLIHAGIIPIIVDNLSNSKKVVLDRIEALTNHRPIFYEGDVRDKSMLNKVFFAHQIDAVIHFAGLKAVGESVSKPLEYYDNNVHGSLVLIDAMRNADIKSIIFSSTATVYGEPDIIPITEDMPTGKTTSPYATSKYMVERCLMDFQNANPDWSVSILRYFNPVGAHPSGTMGEDPQGIPNNLMPYIAQVAIGRLEKLSVYGDDYDTIDGTGVRDYIHVMDLADGHIATLKHCANIAGTHIYNLGTGKGTSVLEMVEAFSKACDKNIPYHMCARRDGDIAQYYSSPEKANDEINWRAVYSIDDMVSDTWHWQRNNPLGY